MSSVASTAVTRCRERVQRVDTGRLGVDRLARAHAALEASDLGGLVMFEPANIRYLTSTTVDHWMRDRWCRCALLVRGEDPTLWDIGSAGRHHRANVTWLPTSGGPSSVVGGQDDGPPDDGVEADIATRLAEHLRERDLGTEPIGVDLVGLPMLRALEAQDLTVVNGERVMHQARAIKTVDELALMQVAAGVTDAAYDELYQRLHLGMREREVVALISNLLYLHESEVVDAVRVGSGVCCGVTPPAMGEWVMAYGQSAFFAVTHAVGGYRATAQRTLNVGSSNGDQRDAYMRARDAIDDALATLRPGATTGDVALALPCAADSGYANEEEAFGLQHGHGVGLTAWESPLISRYYSLEHPTPIEEGMVVALEAYWPTDDGRSAVRIGEEAVVTAEGARVLTKFPADELLVAGTRYWNGFSVHIDPSDKMITGPAANGVPHWEST